MHVRLIAVSLALGGCHLVADTVFSGIESADRNSGSTQVSHIEQAPVVANFAAGAQLDSGVNGSRINGNDVMAAVAEQRLDATLASYADDMLCVQFHSVSKSSSDQPPDFADSLKRNYRLFAPDSLRPSGEAPAIAAARVRPLSFHASLSDTTYESGGRDKIVARHHYRIDQRFEACFARASTIVKPPSKYVLVEFRDDEGVLGFQYAWRFGTDRTAVR